MIYSLWLPCRAFRYSKQSSKGHLPGIAATVITAAPPAWEAASVPPRAALSRSSLERKAQRAVLWVAGLGVGLFASGIVVLYLPGSILWLSFLGTFFVITGFAMLAPAITVLLARSLSPITGKIWGL